MSVPHPFAEPLAAQHPRRHDLEVLGAHTAYWEYGPERADRTIVLVHGFRGDHHGLEPIAAHLSDARLVIPDLPGFGDSSPMATGRHDLTGYTAWLGALLDGLGVRGSAILLGHSFGSIVVAHAVAAGLPARAVVLVNPIGAPALSGPRGIATRLAVFYYWLAALLPERLGFALLRNPAIVRGTSIAMLKTRNPYRRRWVHDQHDRYFSAFADRRVVLEAFSASVAHDVSQVAEQLAPPTLLVAAERDDITSVPAQERLAARIPDARLTVIPRVGHLIHYETPDVAAWSITAFLEEIGA